MRRSSSGRVFRRSVVTPDTLSTQQLNNRFPYFEVAMLAVVAGLGWAAFRAYDALRENSLAPVSAIAEPWRPNLPRVGELLKVQDLADLENKLTALSEQLQTGCAGIRSALESYIQTKNRGEIASYLETSKALQSWLIRQREGLDLRRFQALQDWSRSSADATAASEQLAQIDL